MKKVLPKNRCRADIWALSSDGESVRLINGKSEVRFFQSPSREVDHEEDECEAVSFLWLGSNRGDRGSEKGISDPLQIMQVRHRLA